MTPFAWSQPHDVNEHVAGVGAELRTLGHEVTVLAPSNRASDLLEGRRALLEGATAEVIALGPAVRISRRSRMGVPVGVRANLSLALATGLYDVGAPAARERTAPLDEVARARGRRQRGDLVPELSQLARDPPDVVVDAVRLRPGERRDERDPELHAGAL